MRLACRGSSFADVTTPPHVPRDLGLDLPEGEIRVRMLGHGEPVLCLHGASASGDIWLRLARDLAGRARFWLPDLLSRGASRPRPDVAYDLGSEVGRVLALSRRLAALPAEDGRMPRLVVGHSQGAAIALGMAAADPRVTSLLLVNPVTSDIRRPTILGLLRSGAVRRAVARLLAPRRLHVARLVLARAAGPSYSVSPEAVAAYAEPYADVARAEALMRVLADWRPGEGAQHLPSRRLDARVIAGERDPRIPVEAARRLAERLEAPFSLVPGGGHILPEQSPALLARALEELLAALPPLPPSGPAPRPDDGAPDARRLDGPC